MNDFANIEQLWRQQTVVVRGSPEKIRAVQSAAERIVRSRGRLLRLGVGITLFSLFVGQLLTVVNYVVGGRVPTAVSLAHFGVVQAFLIGMLLVLFRRLRAHRRLRARSAASVRDHVEASLEMIAGEMHDYRIGTRLLVLLLALDLVPLLNGWQQGYYDAAGAAGRIAFVIGFGAAMVLLSAHHCRRVLRPQQEELNALRAQLDVA